MTGQGGTNYLFTARDSTHGSELWRTDGTAAGTRLLKDINPGPDDSAPTGLVALGNGKIVFQASDPTNGSEPWVSDGTEAGTVLLSNINLGNSSSSPKGFVALGNGKALFYANDGNTGKELWVTDGTPAGTHIVKDINQGSPNSSPRDFVVLGNGKALFYADDGTTGSELWVTDGTEVGTHIVKDINPSPSASSSPSDFVALGNGKALFSAYDPDHGNELWVTDGTEAGTHIVKDILSGPSGSFPTRAVAIGNGKALFQSNDGVSGSELWVTDGTEAGTHIVKDITPGAGGTSLSGLYALENGRALFQGNGGASGDELWVTDGTEAGTHLVKDIRPGLSGSSPNSFFTLGNGTVLFNAGEDADGTELWRTDGTEAGTYLVKDIDPGIGNGNPNNFVRLGDDKALFRAYDATHGTELWVTDGTNAGTTLVSDLNSGTDPSWPGNFAPLASATAAPVVTASSGTMTTGEQVAVAVDAALSLSDADSATLAKATVSITSGFVAGQDVLAFRNTDAAAYGNIAGSYDKVLGVLTLTSSGASATVAQFEAALRAVTYRNADAAPTGGTRILSIVADDGTSLGAATTRSIAVAPVNDAPSFLGGAGIAVTPVGPRNDRAYGVTMQADGKVLLGGYAGNGTDDDFAVVRYNVDGSLDTTFGIGGRVITPVGSGDDDGHSVLVQSDGKILVGGYATGGSGWYDFAVVRYNADGSLDTTFGTGGKVLTPVQADSAYAHSMAIQGNGKILLGGYTSGSSGYDFALVRCNADGSLDTTFGTGGTVVTPVGAEGDFAYSVTVSVRRKDPARRQCLQHRERLRLRGGALQRRRHARHDLRRQRQGHDTVRNRRRLRLQRDGSVRRQDPARRQCL